MKKTADIMSKTGKWLLVFGFIFSQLSFPLEVLADEVITDENSEQEILTPMNVQDEEPVLVNDIQPEEQQEAEEPVIIINGQKGFEYTISGIEDIKVEVVLEYQGQKETKTFDFSKKLYGIYQYTFTSVNETVTINYNGNNAELLKPYENVADLTKKLTCDTEECIISGFGSNLLTVADITTNYYNLATFNEYYGATVVVANGDEALLETDTVINGYQLQIIDNGDGELVNTTPLSTYTINRVGDVVADFGIIDIKDQEAILNDILQNNEVTNMNDINEDLELNILDATHSMFINSTVEGEVTDVLTNTLTSDKEEMLIDEEVEVKLFVSGFDKQILYGIEGLLSYNSDVLELVGANIYVSESTDQSTEVLTTEEEVQNLGYLNDDKFAYVILNGFNNAEEALLTFKFKAVAVGISEITISNIIESYGEAFEVENDMATVNVTVLDYGKGGDVEEDTTDTTVEETENTVTETKSVVRPVVLSSDYYIKNLIINGYEIDFNMYTYEYSIKVKHDVTALDIEVLLNDSNSIYYVEGNENFKVGENFVSIVVRAENGSTKTYTIKVEKEKEEVKKATEVDEDEVEEEKNTSKTIIIILIILVIIGLIYVIFKDDEEDAKEAKKNRQPEKKKIEEVKVEKVNSKKQDKNNKKKK